MTLIAYRRISTQNQSNGHSLITQKKICDEYASNNNMNISNEYSDIGTGKNMKNLTNLNNLIDENNNCTLVVVNIDRFSRDLEQGLQYLKKLKSKEITLYSIEQNVSSDNISGLRLVKSYINDSEFESKTIGLRVKKSLITIKKKGGYIGGLKYGYQRCRLNNIPIKVKSSSEKKIIELIKNLRLGTSSSKNISKQIKQITANNKIPDIKFYDIEDNEIEIFDKPLTLTYTEIADILNDYNIKKRNKKFTKYSVSNIFKQNCNTKTLKKIKTLKNNLKSLDNMNNLTI